MARTVVARMTTCIYYNIEYVSESDTAAGRAQTTVFREFISRDSIWPESVGAQRPESVSDRRELTYQDELMAWLSRLFGFLGKAEHAESFAERRGVSLLEVARYQIHSEIAAAEQRWRALCEIVRRAAPTRLIWVAPRSDLRQLQTLRAAQPGLEIQFVPAASDPARIGRIVDAVKALVRPVVNLLRSARASWAADDARLPLGGDPRRVVFTEFFPNNVEALAPVDELLRRKHSLQPIWLAGRAEVKQALARHGIAGYRLKALNSYSANGSFDRRARQALFQAIDKLPDEAFEGTAGVSGRAFLAPALKDCLVDRLAEAAGCVEAFDSAFRRLGNQCVVSASYTSPVGRASALVARRLGRRSIFVQHGFIIPNEFACGFCSERLLLWGEYDVRNQVRNGVERRRIGMTGATIYDELIKGVGRSAAGTPTDGAAGVSIALLASRTGGTFVSYPAAERCLLSVAEAVRAISGAKLVVKPHPSDRTPMIENVARNHPNIRIARTEKPREVIEQSQIVIVVSSTTGIEACVAQKPLIVLEIGATTHFLPYGEYGAALMVSADDRLLTERIAEAIKAIQSDSALRARLAAGRRRLLDDMLDGAQGDAAERVAAEIFEQLSGSSAAALSAAGKA